MAAEQKTFSESWHRVANQRICLHSGVKVGRQYFRGERWVVLENPFTNQFFRLRPAAYDFVARLRPDRTVDEVWRECLDRSPDDAPGQEAVIQLLAQLYHANLLQYDLAADSAQLFQRYKKRRGRELKARLLNLMFIRFPLLDPDAFLRRTMPLVGWLTGWLGGLIWLGVVTAAIKVAIDHFDLLRDQTQGVLAPGNLPLLYLGLVLVKTLHEFGHAYFCRRFGGEVHTMGVMLLIFTPLPYMDATSSWGFRSRWRRILVAAAGMIVEVFVAALATFVWAQTGPGTAHNLAYNIMFVASVSTLLFNLNPLLRFDGYYILTDLLEIPNLHQRSARHLRHLFEHYLFGLKRSESPARSRREAIWLTVFIVLSGIYRVIVFGGILLFVADQLFLLGILMAILCAITWVLVPVGRFVNYLATSPALERNRPRAVSASIALVALLVAILQLIPFPNRFRAPGIVQATEWSNVLTETAGYLRRLEAEPGQPVQRSQVLFHLENQELNLALRSAEARIAEVEARLLQAMREDPANIRPLRSLLKSASERFEKLRREQDRLSVRALNDGVWVAPDIEDWLGRWLPRGSLAGQVVNPAAFEFSATVRQEDVNFLFAAEAPTAQVRLWGEAGRKIPVPRLRLIPASRQTLPSPALGWLGGGEMPVAPEDPEGRTALEPFFEIRADLAEHSPSTVLHGRSGKIRFSLGSRPLLSQWVRRLWQVLQKRYQL
ncbi:MAG: peptidase M50 [Verrucomicrobia bacterium]|nr:peptidase M50 [Verrucomicrobiota bacterium]